MYPVNPGKSEIEGLTVFARLADVEAELDRVSVYLPPPVTLGLLAEIAAAGAGEVLLNPGSADSAVFDAARELGLEAIAACSIVDIGRSPSQYPGP